MLGILKAYRPYGLYVFFFYTVKAILVAQIKAVAYI